MGTSKAFSHTIAEEFRTGFTQLDIVLDETGYLFEGWRKGLPGILPMFLPTEDMDEADEDLDIAFLLLAQYHSIFFPFFLTILYKDFREFALTLVKDFIFPWDV
jgi:hypothetical protein